MKKTQAMNMAFAELRAKLPNVPADTKLSKIKTLRYAIIYIKHLMDLLEESNAEHSYVSESQETETQGTRGSRTDWPDKVWAAELRK